MPVILDGTAFTGLWKACRMCFILQWNFKLGLSTTSASYFGLLMLTGSIWCRKTLGQNISEELHNNEGIHAFYKTRDGPLLKQHTQNSV